MTPSHSLREQLSAFTRLLREKGVDSPRLSAEVLLAAALGLERNELLKRLILTPDAPVAEAERNRAQELVARRAAGEPVAYIVGVREFYGRDFAVSPATLVPRPETEMLVDLALEEAGRHPEGHRGVFTDFGTGTGCIAITLALALPHWRGLALDISDAALLTARANAQRHNTRNLRLIRANFTVPPLASDSLDLLVSNPPYISDDEYAALDREVRDFEPKSALVPALCGFFPTVKASGLEHAYIIIHEATRLLAPGGLLLMEIGATQAKPLLAALPSETWRESRVHKDLAGLDRVLTARKHAQP